MPGSDNKTLSSEHLAMLRASAISDEVIALRGAYTASTGAELERLGYRRNVAAPPALVLPLWGVGGEVVGYQIRPDAPPVIDGRICKYLSPPGSEVRLDIPPSCRKLIGSPEVALWVTEGIKKSDSLASHGLTAIGLAGVWMFRTEDWERIPLDDRRVFICFDSDVMIKREVHAALCALRDHLSARGAVLSFVYLPSDHGKLGADDFLAGGHKAEDLYRLAEDELRDPPPEPTELVRCRWTTFHLLRIIENLIARYVHLPEHLDDEQNPHRHESAALALFVLHTWVIEAASATPYLLIVSPERRTGKTRLLEVLELVCSSPIRAASISAAAIFQAIEALRPSLLIDEIDSIFTRRRGGGSEHQEALRGVLDSGNRPGAYVLRGTPEGVPVKFGTYCPKALSGIDIGVLPDTIVDRSIVIRMERQLRNTPQTVERFRPRQIEDQIAELRKDLAAWAAEHREALAGWELPDSIAQLTDRQEEAWEPLTGVAALAQGDWPDRAREAAVELAKVAEEVADESLGHQLLFAIRELFGDVNVLATKTICNQLNADDEAPFGSLREGKGIDARGLSNRLRPYNIKPTNIRIGDQVAKGYRSEDFVDAWERYGHPTSAAPEGDQEGATSATPATSLFPPTGDVADVADVADNREVPAARAGDGA